MARGESLDLHMATTFCENPLRDLQPDAGSVDGCHDPEAWTVVHDLDTFCIATNALCQLDAALWACSACCVFEDVGERPPQARAHCYDIPWPGVRLAQDDLRCIGVLLGIHRITHQAHNIDCFCTQPGTLLTEHIVNDLGKPTRLGNDLFQPPPDWLWRLSVRQCSGGEHGYRGNWLAQVVSSLLHCTWPSQSIILNFRRSRSVACSHTPPRMARKQIVSGTTNESGHEVLEPPGILERAAVPA